MRWQPPCPVCKGLAWACALSMPLWWLISAALRALLA